MTASDNPQNYSGVRINNAVGNAAADAQVKSFENGGSVAEVRILINQGYKKGEEWVDLGPVGFTVKSSGDYAANVAKIKKGDKVRVDDAKLEGREYDRKDGTKGLDLVLTYGTVTVVGKPGSASDEPVF